MPPSVRDDSSLFLILVGILATAESAGGALLSSRWLGISAEIGVGLVFFPLFFLVTALVIGLARAIFGSD